MLGKQRDGVAVAQTVARIEKDNIIAFRVEQRLVHCIVKTLVGLADEAYAVRRFVLLDVLFHKRKCPVFRTAIHDEVLNAGIVLQGNALQSTFEGRLCVVCDGCYGEERFHLCLIEFDVLLCDVCLIICGSGFEESVLSEVVTEDITYAGSQVVGLSIACHVAVLQVVYHFGYASDVETHTRCAATHGFGNGVGQVVLQAWRDENIDGIVELRHHLLAHGAEMCGFDAVGQGDLLGILAHDDEMQIGILEFLQCLGKIVHALSLVCYLLAAEENELLVGRKGERFPCLLHVGWAEEVGGDAVVDVVDLLSRHCFLCLKGYPFAAPYKGWMRAMVHLVFANVVAVWQCSAEKWAVSAFLFCAVASVMTYTKVGPFVVKRPDDALSAAHDFAHFIERNHALVNPMQVYDVGFLELWCGGDADSGVGDVCLPEA